MKSKNNDELALDELKEKIIWAFKDVAYPGDDKIAIKQWYLDDENLIGYVGRKKEDVTVDFINDGHRHCTTFMTERAIHYYMPAFLILCAEYAEDMDVFSSYILDKFIPPLMADEDYQEVLAEYVKDIRVCGETLDTPVYSRDKDKLMTARLEFFSFVSVLSKEQREAVYYFLVYYENKYGYGEGRTALNRFWKKFKDQGFVFDIFADKQKRSYLEMDKSVIKARDVLKQYVGEGHKKFYVDSIKEENKGTVIHFIDIDIHVLGSDFFVILKKDGTHEIYGGE